MDIKPIIINIILFFAIVQSIFTASFLRRKNSGLKANKYFILLSLTYTIFLVDVFLTNIESVYSSFPHLSVVISGSSFLLPPLILFYVAEFINIKLTFIQFRIWHFLPFIIYKLYYLETLFLPAYEFSEQFLDFFNKSTVPPHTILAGKLNAIQGLIYAGIAVFILQKYSRRNPSNFSYLPKSNINWLKFFCYATLFIWMVFFADQYWLVYKSDYECTRFFVPGLTSFFLYTSGYICLYKSEIFSQEKIFENQAAINNMSKEINQSFSLNEKYSKSGLSNEKAEEYLTQIYELMEKEKLYRNPNLNLKELSGKIGISSHNLSEVLNTKLNQKFFDFVNTYRVNQVKEDIKAGEKEHLTLFAIAKEAGFNSKSGFQSIFKRFTRQTPSEFRKSAADSGMNK